MTSLATRLKGRSELGVAALLGAVGALVLFDAARLVMPYSQSDPVGPKTLPIIVGSLLLVCAVMLAVNVLRGGRGEAEAGEDVDLTHPSDWKTVLPLAGSLHRQHPADRLGRLGHLRNGALLGQRLGARKPPLRP